MKVPVSGKVYGEQERANLNQCADELLLGIKSEHWMREFEAKFREFVGTRFAIFCNSGSSANLLALSALTAEELGDMRIQRGDEIITTAVGFPTTIAPIIQVGAVPVFVDVDLPDCVPSAERVLDAITDKTRAIMLAHTLGVPFCADKLKAECEKRQIWLVEDACDALGTEINGDRVGSIGDIGTFSFYPAHHISTEEGGMVVTSNPLLAKLIRSFRDWGRDCWCEPGHDNTCGRRFEYDPEHKYNYSHIGFNLKGTNMQAAIGCAQMDRLPGFIEARRKNWFHLWWNLRSDHFMVAKDYNPSASYFGFTLLCKEGINRNEITRWLDTQEVYNRRMFAGNILRQPGFAGIAHKTHGQLSATDYIHSSGFWIGCWPGLSELQLDYAIGKISQYCREKA